ncbi:hypothetical protein [Mitsuaria sp. GD03876]|uniref:hypothetical protein n=1 Tax=Mitsuaria sp. GD03876 TaxID=2975399 RepID=UPI0024492D67|nr:hypothetical protein [Mitsuaria sp. GD03876]MDH0865160.1 hypothetical protein [Mitsuaria sp. GD03876]
MSEFHLSSQLAVSCLDLERHLDQLREPKGDGHWPGTRMVHKSGLLMKRWSHERTMRPIPGGSELRDSVHFELRFGFLSAWVKASHLMRFFRLHQSLRARHGDIAQR